MTTVDLLDAISGVDVKYTDEAATPAPASVAAGNAHPHLSAAKTVAAVVSAALFIGLLTALVFRIVPEFVSPLNGQGGVPAALPSESGKSGDASSESDLSVAESDQINADETEFGETAPVSNAAEFAPHDIHESELEKVRDSREFSLKYRGEGSALLRIFVLYHSGAYRDLVTLVELCDTEGNLLDSFRIQGIAVFCLRENDFSEPYTVLSVFNVCPKKDESVEYAYFDVFAAEAGEREEGGKIGFVRSNGISEYFRFKTAQEQAQYKSKYSTFINKAKTRLEKLRGADIVCQTDQFGYSTYGSGEKQFGQETVDFFYVNEISSLGEWLYRKS